MPPAPRTTGTPTNRPRSPNSPSSRTAQGRTRFAIEQDRLDHLERRGRRRVEGRAGLEQGNDLGATVGGPLAQGGHPFGAQQLRDGNAGHRRIARQRHHRVAVAAEDEGVGVLDRDAQLLGDERAERAPNRARRPSRGRARAGSPEASSATWHIASSGLVTMIRIASGNAARPARRPRGRSRRSWSGGRRGSCPAGARGPRSRRRCRNRPSPRSRSCR